MSFTCQQAANDAASSSTQAMQGSHTPPTAASDSHHGAVGLSFSATASMPRLACNPAHLRLGPKEATFR